MENCNDAKSDNLAKQHRFCPPDEPSWCKWKQDETTVTSTYSCVNCLPEIFLEVLKPTFTTLSDSKLLERCVLGTTKNPNECVNSMMFSKSNKAAVPRFRFILLNLV